MSFRTVKSVSRSLPGYHVIIGSSAFLEEESKHDTEEQPEHDLGIFIFMKRDKHTVVPPS